jgi:predicted permease
VIFRLLAALRPGRAEDDLAREIGAHLQLLEDEFVARGMRRDDARLAARRRFGGVEQAKERQRDARSFRWLDDSRIDGKLAVRMLVKYPGLSMISGAGLAVAIAVCAAFFAFFYAFVYSTLPLDQGDRIVALENWDVAKNNEERHALHDLAAWRRDLRTVDEISAFRTVSRNLIIPGGTAEPIRIAQITASGFRLARVAPLAGRAIADADESAGAPPVVVIGYDVWRSRFGGDAGVIGRGIRIGNIVHTVVGVMPDGFRFPVDHQYWTPLATDASPFKPLQGPAIFIFARLRDGETMTSAQAELSAIGARAAAAFPDTHATLQTRVMPYAYPILDIQGVTGWQFSMMQGTVTLLLIIVAANVSILIYARTATRPGEIAVRTALGATRRRIVGQLFIEALVLSGAAAAAGILLATFGMAQGFAIMGADLNAGMPYWIHAGIPAPAIGYVIALTLLAAVLAGVLPALRATGRRMQSTLKQAGASDGLRLGRTWTALIVAQVALAVAGLPAAVATGWSGVREALTRPAFDDRAMLAASMRADPDPPAGIAADVYRSQVLPRFTKLEADTIARLEAEPAVQDVTVAEAVPGNEGRAQIAIDDDTAARAGAARVRVNRVAPDFFGALDAHVIAGRALTATDAAGAAVVVVNDAFARRLLGGANAVGRRITYVGVPQYDAAAVDTGSTYEIVGVMSDLMTNSVDQDMVEPVIFHPRAASTSAALLIRLRGRGAEQFMPRLRGIIGGLDPAAQLSVQPFAQLQEQQSLALRLIVIGLSLIVVSVLMLSAAGIYALMSFTVSQRKKEIGLRAALGADARQLLFSIFSQAGLQLGAGVAAGLALAVLGDVVSGGELLGSIGKSLLPVMSLVMIAVGLIATIGPARRSLRIDPTEALRAE